MCSLKTSLNILCSKCYVFPKQKHPQNKTKIKITNIVFAMCPILYIINLFLFHNRLLSLLISIMVESHEKGNAEFSLFSSWQCDVQIHTHTHSHQFLL